MVRACRRREIGHHAISQSASFLRSAAPRPAFRSVPKPSELAITQGSASVARCFRLSRIPRRRHPLYRWVSPPPPNPPTRTPPLTTSSQTSQDFLALPALLFSCPSPSFTPARLRCLCRSPSFSHFVFLAATPCCTSFSNGSTGKSTENTPVAPPHAARIALLPPLISPKIPASSR